MHLQKNSSISSIKPRWANWTFHHILETPHKNCNTSVCRWWVQLYPPCWFCGFVFFFPKGKSIFHCRKACPSFREASSCQERKAEDWQRKDTAKVLPEHCTKKIILRCWPLTEVCIIKEKNSNIMSWLFPKWENCIRCNVSWEPAVIFFLWFFLQNKKSGMFRGWSPYFPPPWPYSGPVLSNCFGLIICKGMVQLY